MYSDDQIALLIKSASGHACAAVGLLSWITARSMFWLAESKPEITRWQKMALSLCE